VWSFKGSKGSEDLLAESKNDSEAYDELFAELENDAEAQDESLTDFETDSEVYNELLWDSENDSDAPHLMLSEQPMTTQMKDSRVNQPLHKWTLHHVQAKGTPANQ
jgi:hypothetical protein